MRISFFVLMALFDLIFGSYSVALSVDDMRAVLRRALQKIGAQEFHLFGHSYGGSLAYEYLKQQQIAADEEEQYICRSLILCNAIQNMQVANSDYDRLYAENPKGFWTRRVCRLGIPDSLQDALNNLGGTWNGMTSVLDYFAIPPARGQTLDTPALIISATADFAYEASKEKNWRPLLGNKVSSFEFGNCAHYPFYEDKDRFAGLLDGFMKRNDPKK
eukprot:CAMPEP_0176133650 /NCGR_PEP_ID=MMETSP0120_2-20121206/67759_1 /TAXON_ID=160619 /ORGANISM="Kryptoperidinium foliaceum, Strain CCMP 1326" /LENGTH=216 /DNA_ID=CAMNT_0017469251 /DNA_START=147 /DNA_END=797 /DNA_ORIENTATION=-